MDNPACRSPAAVFAVSSPEIAPINVAMLFIEVSVAFVYAPAKFSVPSEDPGVMEICGPVTDKFAGWTDYPDYPVNAIVGIGYEPEKAVGVIEFLEPNKVWILVPSGEDKNYDERVREANRDLWDMFSPKQFISYEVSNPYEYFMILEGLVH